MLNLAKQKSRIFLPSLANLIFLALFLSLSLSEGGFLLSDADTGWHIRAGEHILASFSVPREDIFSFITPAPRWINHQWLSEVIMALVHQWFGLTGIVLFFALLISLSYRALFRLMQRDPGDIVISVFVVSLTLASSLFHWLARPHIFSLSLFVVSYYLLEQFQSRPIRISYLLPPLMLLWVNLHGGFLSGLILIFIYLVGNLVNFYQSTDEAKAFYREKTRVLMLTLLACLLVSLANPYGPEAMLYPIWLISQKGVMDHMAEFQSPNFHHLLLVPAKYFLLLTILLMGMLKRNLNVIEILLMIVFLNMALFSQRFIPLFCVVVAPILVRNAHSILNQTKHRFVDLLRRKSEEIYRVDASARGRLWVGVGFFVVALGVATCRVEYRFDEGKKPVQAVEFLKKASLQGNMFNDDEFGDYIIYSAYPQYRVFIDSRVDMYGAVQFEDYLSMIYFKPGWQKVIEKYQIRWAIVNSDSILSRYLKEREDWKPIYSDRVATIFVREMAEDDRPINGHRAN